MKIFTQFRTLIACFALFSMLFMQLAVAAHNCPMVVVDVNSVTTMLNCHGMHGMDKEQSVLCHIHAAGDEAKQSLDKLDLPQVPPFVPAGLVLAIQVVDVAKLSSVIQPVSISFIRSTSPPVAILHCCFRI